jgi:ribosomal protein L12E/L44/L45/RPP1/RPP2
MAAPTRAGALLVAALVGVLAGGACAAVPAWGLAAAAKRPGAAGTLRLRGGQAQLAAYMLCRMGGNDSPSLDDVKKTLESVGAKASRWHVMRGGGLDHLLRAPRRRWLTPRGCLQVEEDKITKIIEDLNGKDVEAINGLIAEYVLLDPALPRLPPNCANSAQAQGCRSYLMTDSFVQGTKEARRVERSA